MIIVATDEEYKLALNRFPQDNIIKTGVGGLNVITALKDIDREQSIINFGYVGSNSIPIGTEVTVSKCMLYHPNVNYSEPVYELSGNVCCYTSNDFVTSTDIKEPVIFDMELAYILALGFKKLKSIKIVSDNLSTNEYEKNIKGEKIK